MVRTDDSLGPRRGPGPSSPHGKFANSGFECKFEMEAVSAELEFCALNGDTIDVVTVFPSQIRTVDDSDIAHARKLAG